MNQNPQALNRLNLSPETDKPYILNQYRTLKGTLKGNL